MQKLDPGLFSGRFYSRGGLSATGGASGVYAHYRKYVTIVRVQCGPAI
jgi:hypothetical protein